MLLTQPQVQILLTTTIRTSSLPKNLQKETQTNKKTVLTFTTLLFSAGYILQQQTVTSLRGAIRPRLQALKALPQALPQAQGPTVGVAFGEVDGSLRLSDGGPGAREEEEEDDDGWDERESEREGRGKGTVLSLDEWVYSDESEGQKRMREGLGVLDRWAQEES